MLGKRRKIHFHLWNLILILLAGTLFGAGTIFLWIATMRIPDLDTFETRRVSESTKIYDRTGEILLYDVHDEIRRTIIPLEDISRHVRNATVAIEDAEFYEHRGVRPLSFLRAAIANIQTGSFGQGGSTITQQVVKNSLLTTEKKVSRKIKEWILAIKLEQVIGKDEILAHYLNETPYGGNMYGVEEAARTFFGKRSGDVTLAEAAYLAALPQAPTYYSPYGNHREDLEARKNLVLLKMLENGFITADEYTEAKEEIVAFMPPEDYGIKAPHFVLFVKETLEQLYGRELVEDGGLRVVTTLDYELQEKAEEIVKRYALENAEKFNAENAGLVAIDPSTGHILAMVGSRDYFDDKIDGNFNVALGKRQPGSSFKPFVYATAFKKGYLPETVVFDVETEFSTSCNPDGTPIVPGNENMCYKPGNYDNVFRGPISFRNALAQSVNIPAIKALYLAGLPESLETARDFGITTLTDPNRYGLTLVLGGGEVTLLDMTSAYGVFATGGIRNPYESIVSVTGPDGSVLLLSSPSPSRVIDEKVALQISDILSDDVARTPAFGSNSYLHIPGFDVAAKTGTTNDYRDAWIIGYSPRIAVGAWAGNNDNRSMEKKVAGFIIAPLWNEFMRFALERFPNDTFSEPPSPNEDIKPVIRGVWEGNERYFVDSITGKLATEYTPPELRSERFVRGIHSILHWVDKNNPLGPAPQNPAADPQYLLWETPVRAWAEMHNYLDELGIPIPTETDDVHLPEFAPRPIVTGIIPNQTLSPDTRITVSASSEGRFPVSEVDFFLNNKFIAKVTSVPFSTSLTPRYIEGIKSTGNELRVVVYDSVKNKGEVIVPFNVSLQN